MSKNVDSNRPLTWWLKLAIAIISALAGALAENTTSFLSNIF